MALPNDLSRTCDLIGAGQASDPNFSADANKKKAPRQFVRRTYHFDVAAVNANGSNAINANFATAQRRMKNAGRVLGATVYSTANATANATDYATFGIGINDGTGNTTNAVASATTAPVANGGVGNVVRGVAFALTVNSSLARYTVGSWIAPSVTQTASGVATAASSIAVDVEEEDVDAYPV